MTRLVVGCTDRQEILNLASLVRTFGEDEPKDSKGSLDLWDSKDLHKTMRLFSMNSIARRASRRSSRITLRIKRDQSQHLGSTYGDAVDREARTLRLLDQ